MQQAESGQRGYIITGNESYLKPYDEAIARIPTALRSIDSQQALDAQRPQINTIKILTKQRLSELDQGVVIRKNAGLDAAVQATQAGHGEEIMNQLRNMLVAMVQSQYQSVNPGQARAKSAVKVSAIISSMLVIFVLAMCGIILRYVRQAIVRERAIEGAKNEFLSLASHQLRTPATSVKQYLGMIEAGYFGKLSNKQKEAVAIAYKSNETGISIILDATYITTVIENLIDNASKYSPEGTSIRVHLCAAPKTSMKDPAKRRRNMFELGVTDSGVGIGKNDVGKLFMKFSRLDNDYSATSEGSGLGLYWAKQIVVLHGGSMSVRSRIGKGSTFTVRLPLMK